MLSISGACKIYMEFFVSENIFLFKPHNIMKVLRSQALPVVRKMFQGPIGTIIIFRQCVSQKHGFLFLEKF